MGTCKRIQKSLVFLAYRSWLPAEGLSPAKQAVVEQRQYLCGQLPSVGGLAGGPSERVSGAAGHTVDLLPLQRRHQSRPLDGVGGAVSELALVVVAPRVHFS